MYLKEQSTDNIDVSRTVSKICKKNNITWVDHKFILKNIPARLAYNYVEILTPNNKFCTESSCSIEPSLRRKSSVVKKNKLVLTA